MAGNALNPKPEDVCRCGHIFSRHTHAFTDACAVPGCKCNEFMPAQPISDPMVARMAEAEKQFNHWLDLLRLLINEHEVRVAMGPRNHDVAIEALNGITAKFMPDVPPLVPVEITTAWLKLRKGNMERALLTMSREELTKLIELSKEVD